MDLKLEGRVALVSAASRGLGFACAERLAREGAQVVLCSRDADRVQAAVDRITASTGRPVTGLTADVTQAADVDRLFAEVEARFGRLEVLVCNAGGPRPGAFVDLSDADWDVGFELGFKATARLVRGALPLVERGGWGRVVAITSASVRRPVENLTLSNATRVAVLGLMRDLAPRLAARGITFNSAAPGFTLTERVLEVTRSQAQAAGITEEEALDRRRRTIPAGRIGDADDFAALVAFLCSEQAGYITGQTVCADGGFSA